MKSLSRREAELVAIGAAVGSNCVPCVVFHVGEARDCGLTADEIKEAVETADKGKQVPAGLVLNAAFQEIGDFVDEADAPNAENSNCGCRS